MSSPARFKFYHYNPSFAAAVTFVVFFTIASIRYGQLLIKNRTWYFVPFLIGCTFEAIGYVARAISAKQTPNWNLKPYIMHSLLTLLGPTFYAASIYMVLGRLIRLLDAGSYCLIRPKWLTRFFLMGDILSFLGQSGGGGILATAKSESSQKLGNNVILLGLGIQVVFFAFFMVITIAFHFRITKFPTTKSLSIATSWSTFIWVLNLASLLIMVRSVFRMIEYAQGNDGALLQRELYLYLLDATLMLVVAVVLSVYHPSRVLQECKILDKDSEATDTRDNYPMISGIGRAGRF
ncbi:RTA1-domain-containing protein [Lojkania enalia]|uniref:RTA1-domain-containing protein n=1 Tax=Lojkania enalia TaxID=147567 RepID=A0A9P4N169_9PLEO|nr:RTA1-domain-containing protein [Didymosphaeria enalia]